MFQLRNRKGISTGSIIIAVCAIGAVGFLASAISGNASRSETAARSDALATDSAPSPPSVDYPQKKFAVTIRKPTGPPRVATGVTDMQGEEVTVGCAACHTARAPNFNNKKVANLNEFHGGLNFDHGNISCLSCHNSDDYDALKLADGSRVEFVDVMSLCAQCHGSQMKDYEHGVHGGMTGYWDLSRGPRLKNNCIDCHHPHAPQFPKMQPTFKPRDRFLGAPIHSDSHGPQTTDSEDRFAIQSQLHGHSP